MSSPLLASSCQEHPVIAIDGKFEQARKEWIVSPYITTIYALELLNVDGYQSEVKAFILWYVAHINRSDRYGVSGTIYDYRIECKSVKAYSLDSYDSADGYAGLFLYLLKRYYEESGDMRLLRQIFPSLKDTAYLIYYLHDPVDDLTKAMPGKKYHTKYLMDNVESWLGIDAYITLSKILGMQKEAQRYLSFRNELKSAILNEFFRKRSPFSWAKEGSIYHKIRDDRFYPDLFAQIHLLALWGKELDRETAQHIWKNIKAFIGSHSEENGVCFYDETNVKTKVTMEQLILFEWAKRFALEYHL